MLMILTEHTYINSQEIITYITLIFIVSLITGMPKEREFSIDLRK